MTFALQDLRYGLRGLRGAPTFTFAAAGTMALGIGACTLVFSLVWGMLLQPLPYPDAARVVEVSNQWEGESHQLAVPELAAYSEGSRRSFDAVAGFLTGAVNVSAGGHVEPQRVQAVAADAEIFRVLGAEPMLGRFFDASENLPGSEPVAVLSHELWNDRFAADPSIIGGRIDLDGESTTVVGVLPADVSMPRDHQSGNRTQVWTPLRPLLPAELEQEFGMHFLLALGRLAPDASLAQAQAELDLVVERLKGEHAGSDDAVSHPSFGVGLFPVRDQVVGPIRPALLVLLAAVAGVLLIASVNVANLLLARSQTRQREIALRAVLGANRGRIARQLLTESLLLATIGGLGGLGLASWGLQGFRALAPADLPRLDNVALDPVVLALSLALTIVTGVAFGLLPSLQASRTDLVDGLKRVRANADPRGRRWQRALVVSEMALAVVLVIASSLLVRTFWNLTHVDPGYDTEHQLTFEVALPEAVYPEGAQVTDFYRRLVSELESLPAVESVGGVTHLPLASRRGDWNFYPEGRTPIEGEPKPRGDWQVVTSGYFEAMGVPLVAGRGFSPADDADSTLVLVVNRALAQRYWPGEMPLGQRVRLGGNDDNPMATIIGVIEDIRHAGLMQGPVPELYIPHPQAARIMGRGDVRELAMTIRTGSRPQALIAAVRARLRLLDPRLPISGIASMSEIRSRSLALQRFSTSLLGAFSALALVLGAIGIFGVTSYLAAQRRREIGIRLALGASRSTVVGMVVGQGLRPAALGVLLGVAGGLALTRLMRSLLFQVSAYDPLTFSLVALALAGVALLAAYLPARRLSATDPAAVLRLE